MLPLISIRLPGTRGIRYFQTTLFFTYMCALLITFATKFYLPSETQISYKFQAGYHQKKDFSEGIFLLCVENVMHVLNPFFFRSIHGVGRLITYKVLVVISGQTGFAFKIALNCYLIKVPKLVYTSGIPGQYNIHTSYIQAFRDIVVK